MKKVFAYIRDFVREEFSPKVYGLVILFLAVSVFLNYTFDIKDNIYSEFRKSWMIYPVYFLFYAVPYYFTVLADYAIRKNKAYQQTNFWIKSLILIGLLAFVSGFQNHKEWVKEIQDFADRRFVENCLFYSRRIVLHGIPLLILWFWFDKKSKSFYGLRFSFKDLKPYFIMLLMMLPLIIIASFQDDFLRAYPKYKFWKYADVFGMEWWQSSAIFEFFYGLDFLMIELFFRGALVIGLVSVIGRKAVLPMAMVYCYLHFGKPMGEAISSFFGGYILGIIALQTRSIFGGVIIHLGIAYSMEIAAIAQYFSDKK